MDPMRRVAYLAYIDILFILEVFMDWRSLTLMPKAQDERGKYLLTDAIYHVFFWVRSYKQLGSIRTSPRDSLRTPFRLTKGKEYCQSVQVQLMMFSFNMLDYPIQLEETGKVGYWATWINPQIMALGINPSLESGVSGYTWEHEGSVFFFKFSISSWSGFEKLKYECMCMNGPMNLSRPGPDLTRP